MYGNTLSSSVLGVDAYIVKVEAHLENRKPVGFFTVGLPEGAVKESKERVLAAIRNSGFSLRQWRVIVNLAPADIRKEGSAFDLPIAVSILRALDEVSDERLRQVLLVGELNLDGSLRPVKGVFPICLCARDHGFKQVILPWQNLNEARVVDNIRVTGAKDLKQAVDLLNGNGKGESAPDPAGKNKIPKPVLPTVDFSDVKGQENVKRAFEVAASGGHNVIMIGPPGSGKTMIARRLSGILPAMTLGEATATTKIHSVAGITDLKDGIVQHRPFRSPHHTISDVGLIGGGGIPRPGEVSLAHNGILFLDELPEFKKNVLEVLRQPLENQEVTISRARLSLTYPADFMLVAAMNPCPCGYYTDRVRECSCSQMSIQKYLSRISGPLLDRIDIHIEVPSVPFEELTRKSHTESSKVIRNRVQQAREIQNHRFQRFSQLNSNAGMERGQIEHYCRMTRQSQILLKNAMERLGLSARAYDRILKVARTIADLDQQQIILPHHLGEAIQYRSLDRGLWAH